MKIDGKFACDPYLDWHGGYLVIALRMKEFERETEKFAKTLDDPKHTAIVDRFRRELIRLRRSYNKADSILGQIKRSEE